jgi:glycosyltransferase involved in cell wall biosynthesis
MKVNVLMVTYNHGAYIAQAIESVLMQQADFEIELIIGEDCSSDNTREIVHAYTEKFPPKIKTLFNAKNLGPAENFKSIYNSADGDYLALCEGDDFWTDPLKLRKQVDFLERHPGFSFSFHNVNILDHTTGSGRPHFIPKTMQPHYTLTNLLTGNFIQSCSVVYRRKNLPLLPEWLQSLAIGDWPLHILHAEKGPLGYIDEIMGVYRILGSGNWAKRPAEFRLKRSIQTALMLDDFLGHKYAGQLQTTVVRWYNDLIDEFTRAGDVVKAADGMMEAVEAVKDEHVHSPYLSKYLPLFAEAITSLVQQGRNEEALSCYNDNVEKLPYVKDMRKLDQLMARLKVGK